MDDYAQQVAEIYGVDPTDVSATVEYEVTGTMKIDIPDDVTTEEVAEAIKQSLLDTLGLHPRDVEVTVDEDGNVSYVISNSDLRVLQEVQFKMNLQTVQNNIQTNLKDQLPGVDVQRIDVSEDVVATLEFSIDADEATSNLLQAGEEAKKVFEDDGFETDTSGNFDLDFLNRKCLFYFQRHL